MENISSRVPVSPKVLNTKNQPCPKKFTWSSEIEV